MEKPKTVARKKPAGGTAAAKPAARKPRPATKSAAKAVTRPVSVATAAEPVATVAAEVGGKGTTLRKKDLVERVVAASGAKKKDVRGIVEAVLDVLGNALHAGEMLALPPFGKARVNRQKDTAGGETLVVKLRRGKAAAPAKETLAETAE